MHVRRNINDALKSANVLKLEGNAMSIYAKNAMQGKRVNFVLLPPKDDRMFLTCIMIEP